MDLLHDLLRRTVAALAERPGPPESTYRLQFHAGFTFRDALAVVPYLHELGVTHCYASPYLKARPGSQHGYDITDHGQVNPEIGTATDHTAWVEGLREHGMGHILDTVPNHMGIVGNDNAWWNDVLENGPASPYSGTFDIAWQAALRARLRERVLLPILGDPYGKALESGQLRLSYEAGVFTLRYFEHTFPVAPRSYEPILMHRLDELRKFLGPDADALTEYESILTSVRHLPPRTETDAEKVAEGRREKEVVKRRLAALTQASAEVRAWVEGVVTEFNGRPGDPHSFDLLDRLLDEQAYRLSYWRVASDEINYRRFFDINELAALSTERLEVFLDTHRLVLRLLSEGKVAGLRIDHPDGLYDPKQYLERLQDHFVLACARRLFEHDAAYQDTAWKDVEGPLLEVITRARRAKANSDGGALATPEALAAAAALHRPLYVVVEKILGTGELLPEDWPTHGTSGYEFVNLVNGLFVETTNAQPFARLYRDWTGLTTPFTEVVYQKKFQIMQVALSSELHMLAHQLDRLAQQRRWSRDFTLNGLRHALREVIACFPVYRSYISEEGVRDADRRYVDVAVRRAWTRSPALSRSLFGFVRAMLLLEYPEDAPEEAHAEQRRFAGKFQQVTAPVMAKGLEDTAFYVYNRLLSLNEVGGDPGRFGFTPDTLHRHFQERQAKWPWSLSPLSTHDTKRSEDVRARLNVLSEMPDEWEEALGRWADLNEPHRRTIEEYVAPDPNEEYLFYQTLLGAWPLGPDSPEVYADFVRRIQDYMQKALHEAKVHSSWINPDHDYDEAVRAFVDRVLDLNEGRQFLEDFRPFQRRVSHYGLFNALAQTLLRLTAPGVPDTYQGTELWDFSLVDPDNRRPVDYDLRQRLLGELKAATRAAGDDRRALARDLVRTREDGRIKLYVTWRALHCRRQQPGLFSDGAYLPVETTGTSANHVFAFLRRVGEAWALVAVPRLLVKLVPDLNQLPLGPEVWQDTRLVLPEVASGLRWRNVLTGERLIGVREGQPSLPVSALLAEFPVALLLGASASA